MQANNQNSPFIAAEGNFVMNQVQSTALQALSMAILLFAALVTYAPHARAIELQQITSPGGIKAWLVEDYSVPLISVDVAWRGGASQDPTGQEGLTTYLAATLDEGAGEFDAQAFKARQEDLAMGLGFSAGRDSFNASLSSLELNKEDSFEMLRLALNAPRFDDEALTRIKQQMIAGIERNAKKPRTLAREAMRNTLFEGHTYARPTGGTVASLAPLSKAELEAQREALLARDNMSIAVVGAINAKELGVQLDKVFGALPQKAQLNKVPDIVPVADKTVHVEAASPQTIIQFAYPGLKRDDPDYIAAYVMNHILGGGSFSSWLYDEVREKRGLSYSVGSYLVPYAHAGLLLGQTSTRAAQAGEALSVIEAQLERMATQGPTAEELALAKSYLTGSYPLGFDSSSAISDQLVGIQFSGLGAEYLDTRNSLIDAVTLEDIKRVAGRLLGGSKPTIVTVGPTKAD